MENKDVSRKVMENHYYNRFDEIRSIGSGGFSTVFEAKSLKDGKYYAIKKIPFTNEDRHETLKEILFLDKLKSDFIVRIIDSWVELNYYIPFASHYKIDPRSLLCAPEKPLLLHIQMELCKFTLEDYIKLSNYTEKNKLTQNQYSIACQMFTQLLECVHYLHSQNPPIIHRDLKPANVMITDSVNGKCVKLTDFGLSTFCDFVEQSCTKYIGTRGYRAPEVDISGHYNTKADIYSLGKMMEDLFNIDHNRYLISDGTPTKFKIIKQINLKCFHPIADNRPSCVELIKLSNSWSVKIKNNQNLFENIKESVVNSKLNYEKWPKLRSLDYKFLKNLSFASIIQETEEHAIFVTNNGQTYALQISEHINNSIKSPRHMPQLSDIGLVKIICGEGHVLCLTEIKRVYSFGTNNYGQLGNGSFVANNTPKLISILNDESIIDIDCGACHSMALNEYGSIFTWGHGLYGQIGNGSYNHSSIPTKLVWFNQEKIVSISCGAYHCLAMTESQKLYGWGFNEFGQLGTGNNDIHSIPLIISLDLNINARIKKISCGRYHSLVLTTDNEVYSFGQNYFGQLGIGNEINQNRPTKIKTSIKFVNIMSAFNDDMSVGLDEHNKYYVWGNCREGAFNYPNETKFNSFNEAFNIKSNHNKLIQTILSEKSNYIIEKFLTQFNAFKYVDKQLLENISSLSVIRIRLLKAIFVTKDDVVFTTDMNCDSVDQMNIVSELSSKGITNILCGHNSVVCLNGRKEVLSFGVNDCAQLGNGSRINNYFPSVIQQLICKNIIDISRGLIHCLALTDSGDIYSWGNGYYGQQGNGCNLNQLSPTKLEAINFNDITSISCGAAHSMALSKNGNLYSWGMNNFGQLGIGNNINQNKPTLITFDHSFLIKKISCGRNHSLVLTNDGVIYSCGENNSGQLGISNKINQNKMVKINTILKFSDVCTTFCDNISAGLSQSSKYYVWGLCGNNEVTCPTLMTFKSFDQIISKCSRVLFTPKQINFSHN